MGGCQFLILSWSSTSLSFFLTTSNLLRYFIFFSLFFEVIPDWHSFIRSSKSSPASKSNLLKAESVILLLVNEIGLKCNITSF